MSIISNTPAFLISMPGGIEWVFIILAVILLFGGKKIPELAKGLGKGMRDFKDAKDGINSDMENGTKRDRTKPE